MSVDLQLMLRVNVDGHDL